MNHHPVRPFLAPAEVSMNVILDERTPPAIAAREVSRFLHTRLDAGHFRSGKVELRAAIMAMGRIADQIDAMAPVPTRRRAWWRRWFQ